MNSRLFACRKLVKDIDRPVSIYLVLLSSPEDYRSATRRAQEIHDRLKAEGYRFSDSTEIVRQDRDTRV